jgi:hypothetical protein
MLSALAVVAGLLVSSPARAGGVSWYYDSGSVAAGAAIDSGVVVTGSPSAITCFVTNADAGATRGFTVSFIADDGTTVLFAPTAVTVGTSSKVAVTIAPEATASSATAVSAKPTRRMKFQLAAAGASAGRITCIGG